MKIDIDSVTKELFVKNISSNKEDRFAKTFAAKCDMMGMWGDCIGLFEDGELACAMVFTVSKRLPKTGNIQLIHTFSGFRGKGYAKELTNLMVKSFWEDIEYLRVSSEVSAVGFYEKLGFKFLGRQKSGTLFSMCKINGEEIRDCFFEHSDPYIKKEVLRKGRGGCVELFNI